MSTGEKDSRPRPLIVQKVAQALLATGLFLLALAFLAFGALVRGNMDGALPLNLLCSYLIIALAGGLGGVFHVMMARAFLNLDKTAYQWVRTTSWSPLVAIVSDRGKRLDWPEVRLAFGEPENKPAKKPDTPSS